MNAFAWIWLGGVVIFGITEAVTAGLVCIWFVFGAAAALAAALLHAQLWLQTALFLLVSAAALLLTRPLVRKLNRGRIVPTNLDRVIGLTAKVTESVDNNNAIGAVYVDGKTWTARSTDGRVIPAGALVTVEDMEGVKLFVKPCEEKVEVQI